MRLLHISKKLDNAINELETGNGVWNCRKYKLTADYVVLIVTKQFNVIDVKCGLTMNAFSPQNSV